MKKIAVIGSNSFSGSSFINLLLNKNVKVIGLSRSYELKYYFSRYRKNKKIDNFFFQKLDINKNQRKIIDTLDYFKPEIIINYSAQSMVGESWANPLDWYNTNVISTISLIENLKKKKYIKKFIQFSTPEVYGSTKNYIKENTPFNPSSPYAVSRATSDYHLNLIFKEFNFPSIITRAANVYGEYQDLYRIIPLSIIKILKKEKLFLHGGGKTQRSFIHIDDVNNALLKIIRAGKLGETYHIATNEKISIYKLVEKICNQMNFNIKDLIINSDDRVGKDKNYFLNSDKLRSELKWNDDVPLDMGIKKVINWVKENYSILKNLNINYIHKK